MTGPSFPELVSVEVEHMVGDPSGLPLVKLRAQGTERGHTVVMVGQMPPAQAREIALHLLEGAARAEYEVDFIAGARAAGLPDNEVVLPMLALVRQGEVHRHTIGDGT